MGLADRVLEGNVQAAARLISGIEDESPLALQELDIIYPHTGRAHIVGVTGAPGIGKSTLVDGLISDLRKRGSTVGVIAVDPSSPFTGGAVLGDRIRMQHHAADKDVFIRSLASRCWSGGLTGSTAGVVHVMDAMGKDFILIETVGVGQGEIEIARVADTCLVVLSPGTGDEIQVIKAGIMEIADIFVINKADRPGAEHIAMEVELLVSMKPASKGPWKPKVVLTEAIYGKGIENLVAEIVKHREFLVCSGGLEKRRRERAREELTAALENSVKKYVSDEMKEGGHLEQLVEDFVSRKESPNSAAAKILGHFSNRFRPVTG